MIMATPVCNFLGKGSKLVFLCSGYAIIKANLRLRSPSVVVFYVKEKQC
nr:MAG TPA: hypothetical protein [Caudoviricetes sp.]